MISVDAYPFFTFLATCHVVVFWFSAAVAVATAHRNLFLNLYQQSTNLLNLK